MPVRLTERPAPEEMLTIRPHPASFMAGATARVITKVDVRLASTTAAQASSVTCSIGWWVWPTTPPAQLTRTSTRSMSLR